MNFKQIQNHKFNLRQKPIILIGVLLGAFALGYAAYAISPFTQSIALRVDDLPSPAQFVLKTDGTNYWAVRYDGKIIFSSRNATAVLKNAFGNLTRGRTIKEKVLVRGNWTLNGGLPIAIPDYTVLEIDGQIKLGDNVLEPIFMRTDQPQFIEITGGMINGNRFKQTNRSSAGCYLIYFGQGQWYAHNMVHDIQLVYSSDAAIYDYGGFGDMFYNIKFRENALDMSLYLTSCTLVNSCSTYSDGKWMQIRNCENLDVVGITHDGTDYWYDISNPIPSVANRIFISNNYGDCIYNTFTVSSDALVTTNGINLMVKDSYCCTGSPYYAAPPFNQKISTPFYASTGIISPWGNAASPTSGVNYTAFGFDLVMSASGGSISSIIVYDQRGNIIASGMTSLSAFNLPVGYKIKFTYSGIPTFIVSTET
jgi:hypothetical protein